MPDEFTLQRSKDLIEHYTRFRAELDASKGGGRFMPYSWWSLPRPLPMNWLAYSLMLQEYASELANIINDLTHHVNRLRAWAAVITPLSDDEKFEVTHEFIDMLGTVALGQPYAIKSRFAYAAGHLCHQANQTKSPTNWKDDFPKKNLYLNDIEPYCRGWKKYRRFKLRVESIAGSLFNQDSDNFRHAYNHEFSPRFVLGLTRMVSRIEEAGGVKYTFGGNKPLDLTEVADLLEKERDKCYLAFDAFQKLVEEQIAAIRTYEADQEIAKTDT
ncbi:hypothetical protein AOQ73_18340 [Bradyrhizobium pachyrhizi]|uniref:hypothetical protein n=1 Tax=Bradyrhizobium pachyrhizi TaxID=280333 RepID=UPI000704ACA4|nr:hypothetical protein [Bradyrhizobium pachyrhizi]KRQ01312.1 hypothetical protein AOQ73_18340 [Bradyrhizobium pachyrhizi]